MNKSINYEINVPKILKSISENNIIERIIYEAILNSVHSESTIIECRINFENEQLLAEDRYKQLKNIIITDDGIGFNKKNLKSFKTYSSDYKTKDWGSKGTGRFSFLKCCNKVYYESEFYEERNFIRKKINFNIDGLSTEDLKPKQKQETILILENFTISLNIDDIEKNAKNVIHKIYPTLALIKKKNSLRRIRINFYRNEELIYSKDLEDVILLNSKKIKINYSNKDTKDFILYYSLEQIFEKPLQESGYCAGYVNVKEFEVRIKLRKESYVFFLYSEYFDEFVNDERTDFNGIYPKERTLNNPISWEIINEELKKVLNDILNKEFKDIGRHNEILLSTIKSAYPFLDEFIDLKTSNIIGYLDKSDILKSGYNKIDQIKNNLRSIRESFIDNQKLDNEKLNELIIKSSLDLAEYITNRQVILDTMQIMIDNNEPIEDNIHNLIMPMRTKLNNRNKNYTTNNLWLLDDKFMSFTNAMSDKSIRESVSEINQKVITFNGSKKEPDLVMYFNNNEYKDKLIMIEFKSFSVSDKNKILGITQLLEYIEIINKYMIDVKERWYYLITTIDSDFARALERSNFKSIFSNKRVGYFQYYSDDLIRSNIYVLDIESLVYDSNLRNQAFMDIFKEGFQE